MYTQFPNILGQTKVQDPEKRHQAQARLIQSVLCDGFLSKTERTVLVQEARDCDSKALVDLLQAWDSLQNGLSAQQAKDIAKNDPEMLGLWARLARDQHRLHAAAGSQAVSPLMASLEAAQRVLTQEAPENGLNPATLSFHMQRLEFQRLVAALSSDLLQGRSSQQQGGQMALRYLKMELGDLPGFDLIEQPVHIPTHASFTPKENTIEIATRETPNMTPNMTPKMKEQAVPFLFSAPQQGVTAPLKKITFPLGKEALSSVKGSIAVFIPTENDYLPEEDGGAGFDSLRFAQTVFAAGAKGFVVVSDTIEMPYLMWPQDLNDCIYEKNFQTYWLNEPTREKMLLNRAFGFTSGVANDGKGASLPGPCFWVAADSTIGKALAEGADNTALTLCNQMRIEHCIGHNLIARRQPTAHQPQTGAVLLTAHYDHLGVASTPYQPAYGLRRMHPGRLAALMRSREKEKLNGETLFQRGWPRPLDPAMDATAYAETLAQHNFLPDAIFNGAVDNASGCAVVILLARALHETHPVHLAFFTGEEDGLLGSKVMARHWANIFGKQTLDQLVNFDMPAAHDGELEMTMRHRPDSRGVIHVRSGGQGAKPESMGFLRAVQEQTALAYDLRDDAYPEEQLSARSDHASFQNFPGAKTLFFTGGLFPHYHSPLDQVDASTPFAGIDIEKSLAITHFCHALLLKTPPKK